MTDLNILCGDIQIPTEKDSLVLKWSQTWQNLTLFVVTFKFQLTEPYLTTFVGTFKLQLQKTVQYRNNFKDDRILHPLQEHSSSKWKRQFSIKLISKMTEPYIYGSDIQIPADWTLHPLLGHSNSNWKRQFIIEMISKMTENYILCGDIQIPTEKNGSLSKWLQRWQKLTFFVGHLNNNKKETVWYWNDYKDDRTMHPLWGH